MRITEVFAASGYQTHLHMALHDAVAEYVESFQAVSKHPPLSEATATAELTILHYTLEQKRAVALLLAASSVEAVANLYLGFKATSEQFSLLERATFIEKWTMVPSLFVAGYSFPKDTDLYQDLRRLHSRRNALAHPKEKVSVGGFASSPGSAPESAGDEHAFTVRCETLPDRLVAHLGSFDTSEAMTPVRGFLALAGAMLESRRSLTSTGADGA